MNDKMPGYIAVTQSLAREGIKIAELTTFSGGWNCRPEVPIRLNECPVFLAVIISSPKPTLRGF